MTFLLKYPIIMVNIAANILGLLSKFKSPSVSKNIGGKIIAGKIFKIVENLSLIDAAEQAGS